MKPPAPAVAREGTDPNIEWLRFLAALAVMLAHYALAAQVPMGIGALAITGVDLFFVITGYLFAPYFLTRTTTTAAQFAIRRVFRIYPLYALALATYAGLHLLAGEPLRYLPEHLAFLFTWQSYEKAGYYNHAFWSLAVEVEFYLVILLLIWARVRLTVPQYLALLALALVARGALSSAMPADRAATLPQILHYHLPGLAAEFLLGGLVHLLSSRPLAWAWRGAAFVGGVLLWLGTAYSYRDHGSDGVLLGFIPTKGNLGLVAASSYALIMVGALTVKLPAPLARLAVHAGGTSYAIYLWHNAMPLVLTRSGIEITTSTLAPAALATVLLALGMHFCVEVPARDAGRRIAHAMARGLSPAFPR